jgi:hypothetical protein
MYWLYILICLSVKYMIYGLTEKFHFSFIHTMELFAINLHLNKITNFYLPQIIQNIFVYIFYGVPINQTNYFELFYSFFGSIPLLILIIIKDLIFNHFYQKPTNILSTCLKFALISFLPFLTLAIRDICFLNTNSFINSFVAIFVISFFGIGIPAFLFDIIYGKSRLRTRKKYYFLLNNFTKNYKFMSLIHLLQKIIDSIGLALYSFYPIVFNTYFLIWKILFLVINMKLVKSGWENSKIPIINYFLQINIFLINYGFILSDSIDLKITLNVIFFSELIIYLILNIKNLKKEKEKEKEEIDIELTRIQVRGIPDWAINEYLESFKENDMIL